MTTQTAETAQFEREGKTINIADYYARILEKPLQYPRLPLVQVGSNKSRKKKLFPMEFCILKGDQKAKQLGDDQIAQLIKKAAKSCECP